MQLLLRYILLRPESICTQRLLVPVLMVFVCAPSTSFLQVRLMALVRRLSVSVWQTMVELRKVFDAFFACISRIFVSLNFRAEKKDQLMLLKEYKLTNSNFYQVLYQGDLTLYN